jgi:hypothetical protein
MARSAKVKDIQLSLTDATASYLGYAYQGLYALLILLEAEDGESVSVETADDVVLSGKWETLYQLKQTRDNPRQLNIRDEGLWKTLAIWVEHYRSRPGQYAFITSAPISFGDPLQVLSTDADRTDLLDALVAEAGRVETERATATQRGAKLPHQRRARGVQAFRMLGRSQQADLLRRIHIHSQAGSIDDIPTKVEKHLRPTVLLEIRNKLVERLIEWWDRQVVLALIGKRARQIDKTELQEHLSDLIAQHRSGGLPDDYGLLDPPEEELEWDSTMVDQMRLVNAGESRILRGLEAHWRAIRQRNRWIEDNVSIVSALKEYDAHLVRNWRARHGPMTDDCRDKDAAVKVSMGRLLLDWSHLEAYNTVPPIRSEAPHEYLAQGTYQMLAQEKSVGWHPDFQQLLRAMGRRKAS